MQPKAYTNFSKRNTKSLALCPPFWQNGGTKYKEVSPMSFSENLQFLRAQAGVTQEQLAEQLDVSRQSVSKWESAQSFPEMDTLLRICDLYDVNLDALLRGSVEESRTADTAKYDAFMTRFARRISLAAAGILAGLGLAALAESLGLPDSVTGMLFLPILSVCVVVFVASGIQHDNFCRSHPLIVDFYTEEEKEAFGQRFVWYMAGGVGAVLISLILVTLMGSLFGEEPPWDARAIAVFFFILAGAVWSFTYGGIMHDKYDVEKYNRENNPSPEAKRRRALTGTVCAVIMLLATAVYVGLGLAMDLWRSTVWLFAVGGILCAAASVILSSTEKKE